MNKRIVLILAWGVTLLVSTLPNVILQEVFQAASGWLLAAKLGLLALMLALSLTWKPARPLWQFFLVLLVLYLAEESAARLGQTALWKSWFAAPGSFVVNMLGTQLLRLFVAAVMIALLLALRRKFAAFYLAKGDLAAEAQPIPVLMKKPDTWKKLGVMLSIFITGGTLLFLLSAARPSGETLTAALPMLPMILVLAAMNAFSEEMNYRASLLGALRDALTGPQAVMLAAVFFGIGHYYGVPYGIPGVFMAWFLGWLLGKSMVETKGFFWAWFIHFLQDVAIFSFMAIGSVTAGGS